VFDSVCSAVNSATEFQVSQFMYFFGVRVLPGVNDMIWVMEQMEFRELVKQ
jgi:hypothetical protein